MTYQGIELNRVPAPALPAWSKSAIRKSAYNLLAVAALMAAAALIVSAYHPADSAVSNPRFESMGMKHLPTMFRGAPPAN